jgi:hypothetical protein
MNKAQVEYIIKYQRWPFQYSDIYKQYFFIIFPIGIAGIAGLMLYSAINYNNREFFFPGFSILVLAILISWLVAIRFYQNKKFKYYRQSGVTQKLVVKIMNDLGFKNVRLASNGCMSATTGISYFSWGETITIIITAEAFLINSRPSAQPLTIISGRRNLKKLVSAIMKIV